MGMNSPLALSAALVFLTCLQPQARETITERCHAPADSFDNQPMTELFKTADIPRTARQVGCFASLKKDSTMLDLARKCGVPDQLTGSGIYIFVYYMDDCSRVTVSSPDLKHLVIKHVSKNKTAVLLSNW